MLKKGIGLFETANGKSCLINKNVTCQLSPPVKSENIR